jgi:hypothetical protein
LQDDGWWLRRDHVWSKPNPMPESVRDRCTSAHEYLFLLTKSARYYFDAEAIKEPAAQSSGGWQSRARRGLPTQGVASAACADRFDGGACTGPNRAASKRNKRSVWTIATSPFAQAHFATFPPALVEPCILAGTSERGVCSHCGAPWRRLVAKAADSRARKAYTAAGTKGSPRNDGGSAKVRRAEGGSALATASVVTVGWRPSCDCPGADAVPAIVLDPFLGAGTTALVADRLGRDCLGLELSRGYAEIADRRLAKERTAPRTPAPSSSHQPARLASSKADPMLSDGGGGVKSLAHPRRPLPRQPHAQKIFPGNSTGGYGPDYYIQTFDFACFYRC